MQLRQGKRLSHVVALRNRRRQRPPEACGSPAASRAGLVTREVAVDGPITVRNDLIFSFDVTVAFILLFNFK